MRKLQDDFTSSGDGESSKTAAAAAAVNVNDDVDDPVIEEELALLNSRAQKEALKMSEGTVTPVAGSSTSSTPKPTPPVVDQSESEEAHDAFESPAAPAAAAPSQARAGNFHRPIPLHSHPSTAVFKTVHPHPHPRLQAVMTDGSFTSLPSSPASCCPPPPSGLMGGGGQPTSLDGAVHDCHVTLRKGSLASNSNAMSRSISDSTLRRAALHLNLQQSVLPSFTSLQQFKVRQTRKFQAP